MKRRHERVSNQSENTGTETHKIKNLPYYILQMYGLEQRQNKNDSG